MKNEPVEWSTVLTLLITTTPTKRRGRAQRVRESEETDPAGIFGVSAMVGSVQAWCFLRCFRPAALG